jgi:hypothetical protein
MTNLLYLLNEHVVSGGVVTPSSEATGYEAENLITGYPGSHWKAAAADTDHDIVFNLGAANGPINEVFIRDLSWFKADGDGAAIALNDGSDGAGWSEFKADSELTLYGPRATDYIYYDSSQVTAADRYFQLELSSTNSVQAELGKLYAGVAFDPGRDPVAMTITKKRGVFDTNPTHRLSLEYVDLSYTKAMQMIEWIGKRASYHPIVIFSVTDHDALLGYRCMFCQVLEWSAPQEITNRNNFSLVLEELI